MFFYLTILFRLIILYCGLYISYHIIHKSYTTELGLAEVVSHDATSASPLTVLTLA